jgi:hypothetical protein
MRTTVVLFPLLLAAGIAAQERSPQELAARAVAPIERSLSAGVAENRLGMLTSRHPGTAAGHFTTAHRHLQVAQVRLTRVGRDHGSEPVYQERLQDLQARITSADGQSLLNLGSISLLRGQHSKALGFANEVLAGDPDNAEAKAMKARIELAANQTAPWGGAVGSGARPVAR